MGQGSSIEDSFRSDLLEPTQHDFYGGLGTRLGSAQLGRTIAGYNLDRPALLRRPTNVEYIYCIKLPFCVCTKSTTQRAAGGPLRIPQRFVRQRYLPYSLNPRPWRLAMATTPLLQLPTQEWTPYQVVKIGKSENPARRFREILGPFQKLGMDIQDILEADDPQTIEKAKLHDSVVFLVKVQDIGSAEGGIRKLFGKLLGQEFIDDFKKYLDEDQKKRFDDAGMTEWMVMDTVLVTLLQRKFRYSQFFTHNSSYFSWIPPSGREVFQRLSSESLNYYIQRRQPVNRQHELLITLPKINYKFRLHFESPTIDDVFSSLFFKS